MGTEKKPFLEHLEELRKRILFSVAYILLLTALSYFFSERILRFLAKDIDRLVFISPQEAFVSYVKIAFFGGIVLAFPALCFNLLSFLWTALNRNERNSFLFYLFFAIILFAFGGVFAYYVALPLAMKFLLGFSSDLLQPYISVSHYVSFSLFFILAFALAFESPLVIFFLTTTGLVTSDLLRKKRRYFIVALFVVAAILTPPDVVTQLLLALPLLLLYEAGILVARIFERK